MPRQFALIEQLEDRTHFNVAASTLVGPLTKGTTWTYDVKSSSQTYVAANQVVGTKKVGKINCVEIDTGAGFGTTITKVQTFVNLSSAGFLEYKLVGNTSGTGFASTEVHTPSPFNTQYPPSLKAGKTYKFAWTDTITTSSTPGGNSSKTADVTFSVKLVSETLKKVKVAAGTFNCYTVLTVLRTTIHGITSTQNVTHYIAPNIGDVKFVSDGITTTTLKKFVKGK